MQIDLQRLNQTIFQLLIQYLCRLYNDMEHRIILFL